MKVAGSRKLLAGLKGKLALETYSSEDFPTAPGRVESWFLLTNPGAGRDLVAFWPRSYNGKTTGALSSWSAIL